MIGNSVDEVNVERLGKIFEVNCTMHGRIIEHQVYFVLRVMLFQSYYRMFNELYDIEVNYVSFEKLKIKIMAIRYHAQKMR